VDVNPVARKAAAELGIEVHTSLSELRGWKFSKIVSSHALEHVPSPYRSLSQMRRLLRSDGKLLLLVPMADWRSHNEKRYRTGNTDMHLCAWTPQTLGNLLVTSDYAIESIKIITHAFPPRGTDRLLWRISPSLFHSVAWLTAIIQKRRQLFAVARGSLE